MQPSHSPRVSVPRVPEEYRRLMKSMKQHYDTRDKQKVQGLVNLISVLKSPDSKGQVNPIRKCGSHNSKSKEVKQEISQRNITISQWNL